MYTEKVAILVDSGCDVPENLIEKYHMKLTRLHVLYPGEDYQDDLSIQPEMVYRRFPKEIPTTSTPGPQDISDAVAGIKAEGYTHVIAVCISSGLSATYNTVCGVLREEQELCSFVLDTKNISAGAGILAVWAAKQLEDGLSFDQVVALLPKKVADSKIFYYMDTLEYLQKGGRIGLVSSLLGSMLNIKPIISCNSEGVYYTVAKIRGSKQALKKLLEEVAAFAGNGPVWAMLMNGDAAKQAAEIRPTLMERLPNSTLVVEKQITASMAVHTGPGLIGIGVLRL